MSKKFGIISYPDSRNKGDEIQSIAASGLLEKVDYFIPRDQIDSFKTENDETVYLICNGWFTTNIEAWPPNSCIHPLFISFHATKDNGSYHKIISEKQKDYYKKYEPIGCRDVGTANRFKEIGIKSFFSGCMTLTLNNPFGENVERDEILIVDPFYKFSFDKAYINHCLDILIPEAYRSKVKFISHRRNSHDDLTVAEKFEESKQLIERYAKAKMVITSRIHCALPCLALNTPVYFVDIGYNTKNRRDRFEGIMELFNVIDDHYFPMNKNKLIYYPFRKIGLYKLFKKKQNKVPIDWENPKENPKHYLSLRKNIKEKVAQFIQG